MRVTADSERGLFLARSPAVDGPPVTAAALIEAHLPLIDLRRTTDPLLRDLLQAGQCRPHRMPNADGTEVETGGLDITEGSQRVIGADGSAHRGRFSHGPPVESVQWVTAIGARPHVNSRTCCRATLSPAARWRPRWRTCATRPPSRLRAEVAEMNRDNVEVRRYLREVDTYLDPASWQRITAEKRDVLKEKLANLPSSHRDDDSGEEAKRFDLLALRLQLCVLVGDPGYEALKLQVQRIAEDLLDPTVLNNPVVARHVGLLTDLVGEDWWQNDALSMLETMRRTVRGPGDPRGGRGGSGPRSRGPSGQ